MDTPTNPSVDVEETMPFEDEVEVMAQDPLSTEKEMRQDDGLMQEGDDKTTSNVPPGGSMPVGYMPSATGTGMQYSNEHGRTYAGKDTHGKILVQSANERMNKIYGV